MNQPIGSTCVEKVEKKDFFIKEIKLISSFILSFVNGLIKGFLLIWLIKQLFLN